MIARMRDDEVDRQLNELGWTVLRFWGKEILKHPETSKNGLRRMMWWIWRSMMKLRSLKWIAKLMHIFLKCRGTILAIYGQLPQALKETAPNL